MKLIEVAVELIDDIRSYLSKSCRRGDHKFYLTKAMEEQIEAVDLIFLKSPWSKSKLQGIYQKMQWI